MLVRNKNALYVGTILQSPHENSPFPQPKQKREVEDTEWLEEEYVPDDEWMPPKKKTKRKPSQSSRKKAGMATPPKGTWKGQAKKANSSSARQRLMKRFR